VLQRELWHLRRAGRDLLAADVQHERLSPQLLLRSQHV
jgi:hypothetical protein